MKRFYCSFSLLTILLASFVKENLAIEHFKSWQLASTTIGNPLPEDDLSTKTWVEAFDILHTQMSRQYPFTDWKGIDWDELYTKFRPRIAAAQRSSNDKAYYLALREYVYSIPDGHVRIRGDDPKTLLADLIGGGYGFAVTDLDNGRIIAHIVLPNGTAEKAGIKFGAQIVKWDGQPINKALEKVPLWFDDKPPATREISDWFNAVIWYVRRWVRKPR